MSPYPAQVTRERIIDTAWELVEEEGGIDNVPLSRLAKMLGIKAPSLYRHVKNKADLLRGINEHTINLLFDALNDVLKATDGDATTRLLAIARGYRQFALAHPVTYTLAYSTADPDSRPDVDFRMEDVLTMQSLLAQLSGDDDSLTALRGLLALMHGFAMLEINTQLRRGGDLEATYIKSVEVYLRGWQYG